MAEEIILSGKYKDLALEDHFILDNAGEEDILYILSYLSEKIDPFAYEFSGIETKKIDAYINSLLKGEGLASAANVLSGLKPTELKENLLKAAKNDKKFLPIAESYFIHSLLNKAKVLFKFSPKMFKSNLSPKKEPQEERIAFLANYKGWLVVKKLKLEKVQDYEISGILSSINFTIVNKMFDFSKVNDEAAVDKLVSGKRKSISALAEALKEINESEEKKKSYLICKVCEKLGFTPYSSPHMLVNAYPDIKPPKVKGRQPKG